MVTMICRAVRAVYRWLWRGPLPIPDDYLEVPNTAACHACTCERHYADDYDDDPAS
jgi:hypothetical protein